ncbi:MAG: hypothetical protein ACKPKO_49590, partial [Candidatus Fonsibacter sp.]
GFISTSGPAIPVFAAVTEASAAALPASLHLSSITWECAWKMKPSSLGIIPSSLWNYSKVSLELLLNDNSKLTWNYF